MTIAENLASGAHMAGTAGGARPCLLGRHLTHLTHTDRQAVREAVAGPMSDERVAAVLTTAGHRISYMTVRRHRLGYCQCPTDESEK